MNAQPRTERFSLLRLFFVNQGLCIFLALLFVAFAWARPTMIYASTLVTILKSISILVLMTIGVTWIIATGQLDISFVGSAAVANMLAAWLVLNGYGWGLGIACGLIAGAAIGCVNGYLIGYFGLSSLIVTIATGAVSMSVAEGIGAGASLGMNSAGWMGELVSATIGVVPIIAIGVGAACFLGWYSQEKLLWGHYIYAQELNYVAVVEAGINVKRLNLLLFVFSSVMASVAGILLTAALSSGNAGIMWPYMVDGLTAIFLGSMAIRKGQPNILGTIVGSGILAVLNSGSGLMGWTDYQQSIIKGALLLIGIFLLVRFGTERVSEVVEA
jgi:ribose transport system permease protein